MATGSLSFKEVVNWTAGLLGDGDGTPYKVLDLGINGPTGFIQ
jgi:hypothetical protein